VSAIGGRPKGFPFEDQPRGVTGHDDSSTAGSAGFNDLRDVLRVMDTLRPVALARHDGVYEVILDRPAALNALSMPMLRALRDVVHEVRQSSPLVVVLSSSCERAFSVGADLKERSAMSAGQVLAGRPEMLAGYRSLLEVECPVIGAVQGFCLGGGFELALTCDLIVCSRSATLGLPEVTLGLIPGGGGTQLLGRRVGWGPAADLVLTGRRVSGVEAGAIGAVDRVVGGDPREAALELARIMASSSPAALTIAKRALRRGWGLPLEEALAIEEQEFVEAVTGPDRAEGLRAFTENRSPHWPSASR
jgi:enoyl-CoA hydratase/carnithine racemase